MKIVLNLNMKPFPIHLWINIYHSQQFISVECTFDPKIYCYNNDIRCNSILLNWIRIHAISHLYCNMSCFEGLTWLGHYCYLFFIEFFMRQLHQAMLTLEHTETHTQLKKTMQLCHSYLSHTNELFYPFNFFLSCAMSVTHHNHIAFSLYLSVFHSNAAYLNKNQFPKRIKRSKYIHSINAILI